MVEIAYFRSRALPPGRPLMCHKYRIFFPPSYWFKFSAMSLVSPVQKDGFYDNGDLYVEVSDLNRYKRGLQFRLAHRKILDCQD